MGLSFTIAAGPRQRSHSQVRIPRDSWPHFTVTYSRLLYPGEPGPRIYIRRNKVARLHPQALDYWLNSILVPYITPWHGPRIKHRSLLSSVVSVGTCLFAKPLLSDCLPCICLFRDRCLAAGVVFSHYLATGLHAIIIHILRFFGGWRSTLW
jgi:hypothetical protein